jgi:hypothetical protein
MREPPVLIVSPSSGCWPRPPRPPPTRSLLETVIHHRWPYARPGVAARTGLIDQVVLREPGEVQQVLFLGQGSIPAPGGCPATDRLIQAMN